jgi:Tol biopolymer transport system component
MSHWNGWLCLPLVMLSPALQSAPLELVSVASLPALTPSNGASLNARASADLRYVVFESYADNLVAGDTNRLKDILLFDRVAGTRSVISRATAQQSDGDSFGADISADGNTIVFSSAATNLVAGDTNEQIDPFVYTRLTGDLRRLSPGPGVQSNGNSREARISGNGTRVAFSSAASNWVAGDGNGVDDVFAYDLGNDAVQRVSLTDQGSEATGYIGAPSISADGRCVAFNSDAPFVPNDLNFGADVFVRDLGVMGTVRASIGFDGREADSNLTASGYLVDCNTVLFASHDGDLGTGNFGSGLYIYRRHNGWTDLVYQPAIVTGRIDYAVSRNGQFLMSGFDFFSSGQATDMQRINLTTLAVTTIAGRFGIPSVVSDDGATFFAATLRPVALADRNVLTDLYVQGPAANLSWLSARPVAVATLVANGASGRADFNDPITPGAGTRTQSVSDDGNLVLFNSLASNLVSTDNNNVEDVFLRNRASGITTLLSHAPGGAEANGMSRANDISGDGRFVTFESCATNLVVDDNNGLCDVFLLDRQSGAVERINTSSSGVAANQQGDVTRGHWSRVSADGRFVVFISRASNLVPEAATVQRRIYLRDRVAGTTTLVGSGRLGAITPDGRYVVFGAAPEIRIWDRLTMITELVSVGLGGAAEDGGSDWPSVSDDGRYVAFYSDSTNLVADDANGSALDVFVRDLQSGTTALVSRPVDGASGTVGGSICEISGNGRYVAYIPGAGVDGLQIDSRGLLADLHTGSIQPFVSLQDTIIGRDLVMRPRLTPDGSTVVFAAFGLNRSAADITGDIPDVFVAQGALADVLFSGGFE